MFLLCKGVYKRTVQLVCCFWFLFKNKITSWWKRWTASSLSLLLCSSLLFCGFCSSGPCIGITFIYNTLYIFNTNGWRFSVGRKTFRGPSALSCFPIIVVTLEIKLMKWALLCKMTCESWLCRLLFKSDVIAKHGLEFILLKTLLIHCFIHLI